MLDSNFRIVESVGEQVKHIKPGDHAVPLFTGECQECKFCKSGKTHLCQKFKIDTDRGVMVSDETSRFSTRDGVGVALNTATVAIFGLGTIGFAVAQGAKIAGASRIIGVDVFPSKLEQGLKNIGLTDALNPKDYDKPVQQVIKEMTVDYAFECVGNVKLIEAEVEAAHEGWGKAVVTGLDDAQSLSQCILHTNFLFGRHLTGTFFGDYKGRTQMNDLVEMYMNKINEAF